MATSGGGGGGGFEKRWSRAYFESYATSAVVSHSIQRAFAPRTQKPGKNVYCQTFNVVSGVIFSRTNKLWYMPKEQRGGGRLCCLPRKRESRKQWQFNLSSLSEWKMKKMKMMNQWEFKSTKTTLGLPAEQWGKWLWNKSESVEWGGGVEECWRQLSRDKKAVEREEEKFLCSGLTFD